MIYAKLNQTEIYKAIGKNMATAIDFISSTDLATLSNGRTEVDGENVFALAFGYETKSLADAKWEAHKKYIDLHILLSGKEKIGYTRVEDLIISENYKDETDCMFLKGEGQFVELGNDHFVIFWPGEAHMPGVMVSNSEKVKKVVIKILVD